MARQGKFDRLVGEFVATVEASGARVDPRAVAQDLQSRIDAISVQLGITKQTVLRRYIDEDWGREMAQSALAQAPQSQVPRQAGPPEHLAVRVAGRLVAALGQALIYAAANGDQNQDFPQLDLKLAAEAISGLGLAINDCPPGTNVVLLNDEFVGYVRATLQTLRDQLQTRQWTFCPCGEAHGQGKIDADVLKAVSMDLLLLPPPQRGR